MAFYSLNIYYLVTHKKCDFAQPQQWQKVASLIQKIQTSIISHFEQLRYPSQHVDLFNRRRGPWHPLLVWIERRRPKRSTKQYQTSLKLTLLSKKPYLQMKKFSMRRQ